MKLANYTSIWQKYNPGRLEPWTRAMTCPSDFRRNADGSIDFDFYRREAAKLRGLALRRAGRRLSRTLIDVARAALSPILRERPPRFAWRKRFT
jgi:hypothetical protein